MHIVISLNFTMGRPLKNRAGVKMFTEQINLFEGDYFEDPTIDEAELEALQFKVHTSLIYKLGEELIKDEVTAITELVKNAYDADSSYVELIVSPDHIVENKGETMVGEIIIKDEGCGMDKKDIINGWLTLSNSIKKKMKKDKKVTSRFERMPLGDKGLGRLAVQKLGKTMILITKKRDSDLEYTVTIPWGDFRKNTTLENVKISCTEKIVNENYKDGYTQIIIRDLVNPSIWVDKNKVDELESELSQTVSPFKKESNFYVFGKVGERPLDFSKISKEILDGSQSYFEYEVGKNNIELLGNLKLDSIVGKEHRDIEVSEDHFREFLEIYKSKFPAYSICSEDLFPLKFKEVLDFEQISGLRLTAEGLVIHPGNYNGEIYAYTLDEGYIKKQVSKLNFKVIKNAVDFRSYIKQNFGIKIFRDDFAILPYGYGNGGDWLGLSNSQSTSGKYSDLKNEAVIGFIQLYGKESYNLREKTNREGLIEDDYFKNFYLINRTVIKRINKNIEKLRASFREYLNSLSKDENQANTLSIGHEAALEGLKNVTRKSANLEGKFERINSQNSHSVDIIAQVKTEIKKIETISETDRIKIQRLIEELNRRIIMTNDALVEAVQFIQELEHTRSYLTTIEAEYEIIVDRMQELAELAGLGIMAETLTHELFTLINTIKVNTKNISNYYENTNDFDPKMKQYFNYIHHSAEAMRKQISHLSPNFRNVRTKKQNIKVSSLLKDHLKHYEERAAKSGISLKLYQKTDYFLYASIGMMNQVLDNLYLNSEHWLIHSKKIAKLHEPFYSIEVLEDGKIRIWDNGIGIDDIIAKDIFDPFVSNKENGRGLGLYIVSQILEYHNCKIRLMRERNMNGRLYKFEIDLRKSMVLEDGKNGVN